MGLIVVGANDEQVLDPEVVLEGEMETALNQLEQKLRGVIASTMGQDLTEDQITAIVDAAVAKAQTEGVVATQEWVTNTLVANNTSYGVSHRTGDTLYREGVDVPYVRNMLGGTQDIIDRAELQAHSDSDLTKISELFDAFSAQISALRSEIATLKASVQNKVLDQSGVIDIEEYAQGAGYQVTSALGGQITFTSPLVLLTGTGTLWINGAEKWTNVRLTVALGASGDTLEVQQGDIVTCQGMSSITFTPYIAASTTNTNKL